VATVVSGVPLALALGAPLAARRPVPARLVGAAAVVVAGAALVQGGGDADLAGLAFSLLALAGECGFTLLSVPVLSRLGAFSVATHTSWLAAAQLALLALAADGLDALPRPDGTIVLAVAYLAVASALAFTLWFLAVDGVGGGRAGLAAGVIPAAAIASGLPLGVATVGTRTVAGLVLVAAGLALGLRSGEPTRRPGRRARRPGDRLRQTRRGDVRARSATSAKVD
jgi:drug/metabolite transporter (DMT)-like permease